MRSIKLVVFGALALAMTACGGEEGGAKISNKEDAAKAMNRLAYASNSAAAKNSSGSGFGSEQTVTVNGKQGTAKVTQKVEIVDGAVSSTQTIVYDEFSADGENVYDGTMTLKMDVAGMGTSGTVALIMSGDVSMTGEYASHTVFDVSLGMSVTELENQNGAKVSMVMNGYVSADGTRFDYANETVTVEAHAD